MKKVLNLVKIAAATATVLLLFLIVSAAPLVKADAASGAYSYTIDNYEMEMNVSVDRTIQVKEVIACSFEGYDSHGIIRDFPLDSGVRYKKIEATCDHSDFSPYTQTDDTAFLSLYLRGNGRVRGQTRTYTLTYTMIVPALSEEGYLPLDVLGYGWQTRIQRFTAVVTVPEGLLQSKPYSGAYGTQENNIASVVQVGNTFKIAAEDISWNNGITLDLKFADGVLSTNFDYSVLIALGIGVLLLGLAVAAKFFFCKQPIITTTVNLEAPEEMDPLLMGKLIDNKVDSEDLSALIFYLADKGALTIDMSENKDDPILAATEKGLNAGESGYVRTFYEGLFQSGKVVRVSSLRNKFYRIAQAAKTGAGMQAGKMYETKSKVLLGLFAVLSTLLLGGFALIYSKIFVYSDYIYWVAIPACLLAFALAAAGSYVAKQREYKWNKALQVVCPIGAFLLSLLFTVVFLIVKNSAFGAWTGFVLVLFSACTGTVAGTFIVRTKEYSERLGHILGFKQFILFTERDKIEFMLKENPELYYHVLPYAQVLGVTDAWTDKFKGLDLQPPTYSRGYDVTAFDIIIWNSMFRSMATNMARTFVSRPSSSGGGFNRHGGFGGGFGGGGFGGGGGRGC